MNVAWIQGSQRCFSHLSAKEDSKCGFKYVSYLIKSPWGTERKDYTSEPLKHSVSKCQGGGRALTAATSTGDLKVDDLSL